MESNQCIFHFPTEVTIDTKIVLSVWTPNRAVWSPAQACNFCFRTSFFKKNEPSPHHNFYLKPVSSNDVHTGLEVKNFFLLPGTQLNLYKVPKMVVFALADQACISRSFSHFACNIYTHAILISEYWSSISFQSSWITIEDVVSTRLRKYGAHRLIFFSSTIYRNIIHPLYNHSGDARTHK